MQFQFAPEVGFVSTEIEVAVATEVNEDDLLLALFTAPLGLLECRG